MLKKAGIVVAAAAAGLLALSPLAFAGDKGGNDHGAHEKGGSNSSVEENSNRATGDQNVGLVNVARTNVNTPIQACNNDVPILSDFYGALTLTEKAEVSRTQGDDNRACTQDAPTGDPLTQTIHD